MPSTSSPSTGARWSASSRRNVPDALLPTMGGQTALNCALDLVREGVLEKYSVELIAAVARSHRHGGGPRAFRNAHARDRSGVAALAHRAQHGRSAGRASRDRLSDRSFVRRSRWAARAAASRTTAKSSSPSSSAASMPRRPREVLLEESVIGWKEYEMEVVRDRGGQLHHHLLDREPRSDGRAHGRLDHGRAGADAHRQGISDACAMPRSPCCARSASSAAARTCSSPLSPTDGRSAHHRDESARVALVGARVEGDGLPDREDRREARGRLHAR